MNIKDMKNLVNDEAKRLEAIRDTGMAEEPVNVIFEKITRMAKVLFKVPIVTITVMEKDKQLLKSVQGLDVDETTPEVSFCVHTIKTPGMLIVEDARQDTRFKDNPLVTGNPNIVFYAGCPISVNDQQRIGTLCVIDTVPRELTHEELYCLQDLASMVEIEINKKYLKKQVVDLSSNLTSANEEKLTDDLTKVYNRRGIREKYYNIVNDQIHHDTGFYLVMLDMDNLKTINDKLGHQEGDATLRAFARICVATIRPSDYFGRIGGDEFVAIIQTDQEDKLRIVLDRLMDSITSLSKTNPDIPVSVTMGAIFCKYHGDNNFEQTMHKADEILYEGKRGGKNKYIIK